MENLPDPTKKRKNKSLTPIPLKGQLHIPLLNPIGPVWAGPTAYEIWHLKSTVRTRETSFWLTVTKGHATFTRLSARRLEIHSTPHHGIGVKDF